MSSPNDVLDLLLVDERSPQQEDALRQAIAQDPAAAAVAAQWRAVRAALRERLEGAMPGHDLRDLLVLYALRATGHADDLTAHEHDALHRHTPAIEQALREHPGLHDALADLTGGCADFERCWAHTYAPRRQGRPDRAARPSRRGAMRWAWRIGAGVAVAAFAVILVLVGQRDAAMRTATTAAGETQTLTLADGSTVLLMERSRLAYPDPDQASILARRTRLEGRAFFEVVPDEAPFVVETATALVTVLGTSFSVEAEEAQTEVVVAEGAVGVAPAEAAERMVTLAPGQMSRVAAGALPSTPAPVELSEALAWSGRLFLRATPLAEVAERLSHHYDVAVRVAPTVADEAVTGTFYLDQPLRGNLDLLATALGVRVVAETDGGFRLTD